MGHASHPRLTWKNSDQEPRKDSMVTGQRDELEYIVVNFKLLVPRSKT